MLKIATQSLNSAFSALIVSIPAFSGVTSATAPGDIDTFSTIQRQINKIKSDESAERRRVEKDAMSRYLGSHQFTWNGALGGVNQRAVVAEEISTVPSLGFSGSPAIFAPHAREVALGIDYWIEPSIVWQTEFDIELPRAGGTLFSFNGTSTPTASPIGATSNDHRILTQFAIGF